MSTCPPTASLIPERRPYAVERPHRHPKGSRSAPNSAADSARREHRDKAGRRRDNPPGRRTFPANECPSDAQSDNAAKRRGNRDSPTLQRGPRGSSSNGLDKLRQTHVRDASEVVLNVVVVEQCIVHIH